MSEKMLEYLINDNDISEEALDESQIKLVKEMIAGVSPRTAHEQQMSNRKMYLYEIVANKRNSVDVDKVCEG
jgi:hypothetical protein